MGQPDPYEMMEDMPATVMEDWKSYFKVRAWERKQAEKNAKKGK